MTTLRVDPAAPGDAAAAGEARSPSTSATGPLLRVRGLRKRFGDHEVLRGIDLDVMPGDRIAILGASGSGKSTLLRCINFMELPSAGVVELGGAGDRPRAPARGRSRPARYDEAELTRVRQRVGMVFQQFNLFPHMTALGNVMEGAAHRARPARGRGARARAGRAARGSASPTRPTHYPAHLSGGPEAARRDRARAGDGPGGAAVRRADLGARPRAGRRGAARDPRRSPRKAARCCW